MPKTFKVDKDYQDSRFDKWFKNEVINCLIITSDYHLRRSLACFKKTNLQADPYVKKPTTKHFDLEYLIVPQSSSLFGWKILLHEIVGYYTYKLLNYI